MKPITSIIVLVAFFITACNKRGNREMTNIDNLQYVDSLDTKSSVGIMLLNTDSLIDAHGEKLSVMDIAKNNSCNLFVRYSNYSCVSCIKEILNTLKQNNVTCFLLIAKVPLRDVHVIESEFSNTSVFKCEALNVDFDLGVTPYAFTIDENKRVLTYHYYDNKNPAVFLNFLANH